MGLMQCELALLCDTPHGFGNVNRSLFTFMQRSWDQSSIQNKCQEVEMFPGIC
jgi:hypothetical protein